MRSSAFLYNFYYYINFQGDVDSEQLEPTKNKKQL